MGTGWSTNAQERRNFKLYDKTHEYWEKSFAPAQTLRVEFKEHTRRIYQSLAEFEKVPFDEKLERMKRAGDKLSETSVDILCTELIRSLSSEEYFKPKQEDPSTKGDQTNDQDNTIKPEEFIEHALKILVMITDSDCCEYNDGEAKYGNKACSKVLHHKELVLQIVNSLNGEKNKERDVIKKTLLPWGLFLLRNLAVYKVTFPHEVLDDKESADHLGGAAGILKRFGQQTDHKPIRLAAVLALACTDVVSVVPEMMQFLLLYLSLALDNPDHRILECSASAMTNGIKHLIMKSTQSTKLVQLGVLHLMLKGLRSAVESEMKACIDSILCLSFDDTCNQEIKDNKAIVDLLVNIRAKTKFDKCQRTAERILLRLGEISSVARLPRSQPKNTKTSNTSSVGRHVMLSYQTRNRDIVIQIKNYLHKKKIKTWMDVDDITKYGSTIEAMARGVDDAGVFLLCYSEHYYESLHCRDEAEYAKTRGKNIIPVRLQRGYDPKDWLGFIVGGKHYCDFSAQESASETDLKELYKKIRQYIPKTETANTEAVTTKAESGSGEAQADTKTQAVDKGKGESCSKEDGKNTPTGEVADDKKAGNVEADEDNMITSGDEQKAECGSKEATMIISEEMSLQNPQRTTQTAQTGSRKSQTEIQQTIVLQNKPTERETQKINVYTQVETVDTKTCAVQAAPKQQDECEGNSDEEKVDHSTQMERNTDTRAVQVAQELPGKHILHAFTESDGNTNSQEKQEEHGNSTNHKHTVATEVRVQTADSRFDADPYVLSQTTTSKDGFDTAVTTDFVLVPRRPETQRGKKRIPLLCQPLSHETIHAYRPRPICFSRCRCERPGSQKDVKVWLQENNLEGCGHSVKSLTRRELEGLLAMKKEAPDFFYKRLWHTLKLRNFAHIENFKEALKCWEAMN